MNAETKHTPGPWSVDNDVDVIASLDGITVVDIAHVDPFGEKRPSAEADARLIATAPELLEALKDMREGWRYIRQHHGDLYGVGWDRAEQAADAAIAKASGADR